MSGIDPVDKKKVLIVDDSVSVRLNMREMLVRNGFTVLEAVDGTNALEVLANNQSVALVLTDLNMPSLDGLGLVRAIRGNRKFLALPIIVQTTEADGSVIAAARQAGASGWLIKPYDEAALLRAVGRLLGSPKTNRGKDERTPT
jgi:two-component system chemotaxis response regulator CheY